MNAMQTYLPGFEPPETDIRPELVTEPTAEMLDQVCDDPKILMKIGAHRMREAGIASTLTGCQVIGTQGRMGIKPHHYVGLMRGVAKQIIRDENRRIREVRENA